jgi:hypothetical protein
MQLQVENLCRQVFRIDAEEAGQDDFPPSHELFCRVGGLFERLLVELAEPRGAEVTDLTLVDLDAHHRF